jgi:hypothetical protein
MRLTALALAGLLAACIQSGGGTIEDGGEDWEGGDWIPIGPAAGGEAIMDSTPHIASLCLEHPDYTQPDNHFGDSAAIATIMSRTCFYAKSRIYSGNTPIRFLFHAFGYAGEFEEHSQGANILIWDQKDDHGVKTPGEYEWRIIVTYGNRVKKKYRGVWKV